MMGGEVNGMNGHKII